MFLDTEELLARIPRILTLLENISSKLEQIPESNVIERRKLWNTVKNKPLELKLIQKELQNRKAIISEQTQYQIATIEKLLNEIQPGDLTTPQFELSNPKQGALPTQYLLGRKPQDRIGQKNDQYSLQKIWLFFLITGIVIIFGASIWIGFGGISYALYPIAGVLGIYLAVLIFFYPELGAYILLLTTISSLSDVFTNNGLPSINQPLVLITFICILANQALQTGRVSLIFKPTRVEWAILTYYVVIMASIYVANDRSESFSIFIDFTKNLILVYCIFTTLNTPRKIKTGIWIVIIVAAILSSFGVYQLITGNTQMTFGGLALRSTLHQLSDQGVLRYSGPVGDANIWPQILAAVLPLAIYRFLTEKTPLIKFASLLACLLLVTAIFYTYSRGAFITVVAILVFIALERRISFTSSIFVIILGLLVLSILPQSYRDRVSSVLDIINASGDITNVTDDSFSGRINEMRVGLAMFEANPFLGVGVGNYPSEYWTYAPSLGLESDVLSTDESTTSRQAHNLFIEVLSETGLFGMLSCGIFIYILFRSLWQNRDRYGFDFPSSLMISIMMAILSYLFSGFFLHGVLYRWFWIFISLALAGLHLPQKDNVKSTSLNG